jgi:hypothetical protein
VAAYGSLARSERELELLMRRVDRAVAAGRFSGDAEILDAIQQARDLWGQIPYDLRGQILGTLRRVWDLRGAAVPEIMAFALWLVRVQRMSVPAAVMRAGNQFNLRPRHGVARLGTMTPAQVRQYHGRQLARGRKPGRNPGFSRGRNREMEHPFEQEMGRRPSPEVVRICRSAAERANRLRHERACATSTGELNRLRGQANHFVKRWGNQMAGKLPRMHPADIDLLIGCLARLEHAVGARLPALDGLRAAATRRG